MNILVTLTHGDDYKKLAEITHPLLQSYADRIGAKFLVLENENLNNYEYDRAIIIHSDVLIRPDTPSLFNVVPKGWIGAFNTGKPLYDLNKFASDNKMQEPKPWGDRWYSTGVVVVDRATLENSGTEWAYVQPMSTWLLPKTEHVSNETNFNYYLNQYIDHDKILDIGPRFNRMPYFEEFSNHYPRFEFYIIHYSQLLAQMGLSDFKNLIQEDIKIWGSLKEQNYHIPRPIVVHMGGGLGDQVCAEPVVRELRRLYPNDHLLIENHWPELWDDLKGYNIDGTIPPKTQVEYPTETLHFYTYGGPDFTLQHGMTHSNMCSTDLTSHLMLNRPLPPEKRQIQIAYSEEIIESTLSKLKCDRRWLETAIVLHPGLTWHTRTLATEVWQELIELLLTDNWHVVVIGKGGTYDGPGRVEKIGVLDFDIPVSENIIDARNILTVKETLSLLDHSKILISNDSSPIHLAGATDIWIFGICTSKHPHFVFPYRRGTTAYKTLSLSFEPECWPCGVNALKSFPEGLRVDLCKNYNNLYCCHPTAKHIYNSLGRI